MVISIFRYESILANGSAKENKECSEREHFVLEWRSSLPKICIQKRLPVRQIDICILDVFEHHGEVTLIPASGIGDEVYADLASLLTSERGGSGERLSPIAVI